MTISNADILERMAIRERIDLYIDSLNHRAWDVYEDLWTEDCVYSTSEPSNHRVIGRAAMMDFLRTYQQFQYGFVFQMGHGVVVELLSSVEAKARHTLQLFGDAMECIGIYYDLLRKGEDGLWRFKRRHYEITYYAKGVQPGKVYRTLPDPRYLNIPPP